MAIEPLTVLCVQVGNYCGRGEEYVRILRDQVARNIGEHRFVCVTDAPIDGIECIAPPKELRGWWTKLWLFEQFKEGRYLYLDLDTVLVGHLDKFAEYEGKLALLRDFYRHDGCASGVMMWNGDNSYIWNAWDMAGRPEGFQSDTWGDQAWLQIAANGYDFIQDAYPGLVMSYKRDVRTADDRIPNGAAIVCFHGKPRPHEVLEGWVPEVWKIGGIAQPRWIQHLNTPVTKILEQADFNLSRDLPMFIGQPAHKGEALIVGGGSSLTETLPNMRMKMNYGGKIFALNNTHDFLIERGIIPSYHVLLDARQDNVSFVANPHKRVTYLLAAQCHCDLYDALQGHNVMQWVAWVDGMHDVAARHQDKPIIMVGGGNTVGLKTMCLAYLMGYRNFHLYGFDSSYRGEKNHAYKQPLNDGEAIISVTANGKTFKTARWMARQAEDFQKQYIKFTADGCKIKVHGDGLIPWIAKQLESINV